MSPWVLILYIGIGYGGGSVAVDMPNRTACERELGKAATEMERHSFRFRVNGYCLNREAR